MPERIHHDDTQQCKKYVVEYTESDFRFASFNCLMLHFSTPPLIQTFVSGLLRNLVYNNDQDKRHHGFEHTGRRTEGVIRILNTHSGTRTYQ